MKNLQIQEIADALGIAAHCAGTVSAMSINSRELPPGCLFIAIKGENFDGHDYAVDALKNGAAAVLCERACGCGEKELRVLSTRTALLQLAAWYRAKFDIPVAAVTGSVGKTSTKDAVALVLSQGFRVLKSELNRNNEIGLPLTLFGLSDETQLAVLELGMSDFGEIGRLSHCVKPSLAILTNIGVSHIETLGTRENIRSAKLEILAGMAQDAPIILNADDPLLCGAQTGGHPVYTYGIDAADCGFRATDLETTADGVRFTAVFADGTQAIELPVHGRHMVSNALAALAAGVHFGIAPQAAAKALAEYVSPEMRQRIRKLRDITLIEDCYNASPDSQNAALNVLRDAAKGRRIAVLGDMLELGDWREKAHRDVGIMAAQRGADMLLTYGEASQAMAAAAKEAGLTNTESFLEKPALMERLLEILQGGDTVLFKASRGMRLEEVIAAVDAAYGKELPS